MLRNLSPYKIIIILLPSNFSLTEDAQNIQKCPQQFYIERRNQSETIPLFSAELVKMNIIKRRFLKKMKVQTCTKDTVNNPHTGNGRFLLFKLQVLHGSKQHPVVYYLHIKAILQPLMYFHTMLRRNMGFEKKHLIL